MERATVVVALPSLMDDEVYKISSEEVPHLTLLYLGNVELSGEAILYVQHAAKELSPFGMSVDYRGTLGEDEADVIFFEKNWAKRVEEFRHHLLLNDEIKQAYEAADQHPEWTPHLTLGYPGKPAREGDENRIRYVDFDRIAVWEDDFAGPEFRLKYDDFADVAMSTSEKGALAASAIFGGEPVVEHYGVKGMRWGVTRATKKAERYSNAASRHRRIAEGTASGKDKFDQVMGKDTGLAGGLLALHPKVAAKLAAKYEKGANRQIAKAEGKQAKADAKVASKSRKEEAIATHKTWKEDARGTEMANKVFEKATKDFEATAKIINDDPAFKGKDVSKGALARQYQGTMNHYFNQHLAQASVDLTMNDQGRAYIYQFDARSGMMKGTEHQAVLDHADGSKFEMPDYNVELDELGHMVGFSVAGELYHYGVKGMRWGITNKDRAAERTPTDVDITQKVPGKFAKTTGGANHPLHEDAATALAARQKAKASTTDALSNRELQAAVTRMNLEAQYNKLSFANDRRSRGVRFVSGLLGRKRYGGKDLKFKDMDEEVGEQTRKAVKKAIVLAATR
jgi:2'-5' RNA ligase